MAPFFWYVLFCFVFFGWKLGRGFPTQKTNAKIEKVLWRLFFCVAYCSALFERVGTKRPMHVNCPLR